VQREFDLDSVTLEQMEEMKLMKDFENEQKKSVVPTPCIAYVITWQLYSVFGTIPWIIRSSTLVLRGS
jgi:hypothetical protein